VVENPTLISDLPRKLHGISQSPEARISGVFTKLEYKLEDIRLEEERRSAFKREVDEEMEFRARQAKQRMAVKLAEEERKLAERSLQAKERESRSKK
jgi:hypothetical protein